LGLKGRSGDEGKERELLRAGRSGGEEKVKINLLRQINHRQS
jgi:hypothetical protein